MPKKILKLRELGDTVLRKKAKKISAAEIKSSKFQKFTRDLIATCEAKNGVGIAAPQVGISKSVFILWSRPNKRYKNVPKIGPLIIINPKIVEKSRKKLLRWEGCLSIPGLRGKILRYETVGVEYLDDNSQKISRKFSGFPARIFQHESDHLNGILFIDRVKVKDLVSESEFRKIVAKNK